MSNLIRTAAALAPLALLAPAGAGVSPAAAAPDLLAIRVGRAETIANGPIEHAVILIENGKIVAVGEDLPVERGIPTLDRPSWVVMPGLVNPYSRLGLESRSASAELNPEISPLPELLPRSVEYRQALEAGVTTLGVYPPGLGIPGQGAVIRPKGATAKDMTVAEAAYLKIYFRSDARSKKLVKDAFKKLDEYDEKVKKAKEKFDEEQEKAKKKSSEKKDEKKDESKEPPKDEEKKPEAKKDEGKKFEPPAPDAKVAPFVALRDKELRALVSIGQASDWLHWLDAIGEREFDWSVRVPMTRELDLYEIADEVGKRGTRVVLEPELTLHPGTMRQRNLPAELARAGAKIVLIPRNDTIRDHERWLANVGEIVAAGLDRAAALRAVTLEPAALIGQEAALGSLEKDKTANLLFLDGDPLEVGTRVKAVMLEGTFVFGEVSQ